MKIGRNSDCPCGSGKKFKKCCINNSKYTKIELNNGIPRKYMCEFGLHSFSSQVTICYPTQLGNVDVSNSNYHIYMINKILRLSFVLDSLIIQENYVKVKIQRGIAPVTNIEIIKIPLPSGIISCEFENDKVLVMKDSHGGGIKLDILYLYSAFSEKALNCEILYIGQSYGKKGERDALIRLKSHETLQKVLADISYGEINYEIAITLWEFTPRLQSSMDGRSEFTVSEKEDEAHFLRVLSSPPLILDGQIINVTEAALINYFKPEYNTNFVNNFPDISHKGYQFYYDYDYNSIIVELDNSCINTNIYSQKSKYSQFRGIKYALNSEDERRSMFEIS